MSRFPAGSGQVWFIILVRCVLIALVLNNCAYGRPLPARTPRCTNINGHSMCYEALGRGRPLVLLHGGGDSGRHSFEKQLEPFSRHFRLILPDQVGHGRTPDSQAPLSYQSMTNDTVALLKHLHLNRVDLVGYSDGGILALMICVQHPTLVRRVIISGVNVTPDGLNPDELEELRAQPDDDNTASIDARLRKLWLNSPTAKELNLSMLSKIRQPVLIMAGDRDAILLEHTVEIYRAIPLAELFILPDTEHDTFGSRAAWVNPIALQFLQRQ